MLFKREEAGRRFTAQRGGKRVYSDNVSKVKSLRKGKLGAYSQEDGLKFS